MENKQQKIVLYTVAGLLLVAAVVLGVLLAQSKQQNSQMQELFAIEKEELESEYQSFATQYDELKIRITNDSLQIKLEQEKLRTQQLLEELKQTKETMDTAPADRTDIIEEARKRMAVYQEFAPADLTPEQITEVIKGVFAELEIEVPTAKDKGRIMKVLMPLVKGKADGKVVNEILAGMMK